MGVGLGLPMIYGFVRQSGGQARLYSEPGHGAMVCLYLPRHLGPAAQEAPAPEPRRRLGRARPRWRWTTSRRCGCWWPRSWRELGYTAPEAADGVSGLRALRPQGRIDLLITDLGLPGGRNGRQMANAARALRPGLKVLFITGYAENATIGNGHLEPGMHVLIKPFAMAALAGKIRDIIGGG